MRPKNGVQMPRRQRVGHKDSDAAAAAEQLDGFAKTLAAFKDLEPKRARAVRTCRQ